jgi:hypothetical protein
MEQDCPASTLAPQVSVWRKVRRLLPVDMPSMIKVAPPTFLVDSWAEHLRQQERSTRAERVVTEQVQKHTRGEPIVRHLVYETADTEERIADDDHRLTGA